MRAINYGVLLLSILWISSGIAQSAPKSPLQAPSQCHYLNLKRNAILGDWGKTYAASLQAHVSADVVCVGDSINIDRTILSNGGDVIIYGNSVHITKPIDTRVYIDHAALDHFENEDRPPSTVGYKMATDVGLNPGGWPGEDYLYLNSYIEYYQRCVDCLPGTAWIPEAPSGISPLYEQGPGANTQAESMVNGYAPRDDEINFKTLKAGNVYIIAHMVEVAENLQSPYPAPTRPTCGEPSPSYVPFAIDARGMKGGRGGAGSPSACSNKVTHSQYDCAGDSHYSSGSTGPGGRGGDAGSVIFVGIKGWPKEVRENLLRISSVKGGEPGDNKKLRGPSARGTFAATGDYCDFYRRPEGEYPLAATGQDGEKTYVAMDASSALRFVGQLVQSKDARLDYDYSELALRAQSDPSISHVQFDDFLAEQLALHLGDAEVAVLNAMRGKVLGKTVFSNPLVPPYLAGVYADELLGVSLTNRTRVLARQLSNYSKIAPKSPVMEYFRATGGLFNIGNARPIDRFYAEAARIDANTQVLLLGELKTQLVDISTTLANIDIREERRDRLAAIADLQEKINAAVKAATQNQGANWAARLLTALGDAAKASGAMYDSYSKGDASQLLKSAADFLSSMDTARNIWAAYGSGGEALPALREQMQMLQWSYAHFLADAAKTKQLYSDSRVQSLEVVLRSRVTGASRMLARHAQFDDLLRMSIITYYADPARSLSVLQSNLDSIEVFLTTFPRFEPFFQFKDVSFQCGHSKTSDGNILPDPGCSYVKPSSRPRVLKSDSDEFEIPLYFVAPHRQGFSLPTFGLRTSLSYDDAGYQGDLRSYTKKKNRVEMDRFQRLLDVPFR